MLSLDNFLNAAQLLALVPICGGTVTLGALAAPQIFKNLNRGEAGKLITQIFLGFDHWIKFSAALLLGAKLLQVFGVQEAQFIQKITSTAADGAEIVTSQLDWGLTITTLLVVCIAAISFHLVFRTTPALQEASRRNKRKDFDKHHKESEILHRINFLLALVLMFSFAS